MKEGIFEKLTEIFGKDAIIIVDKVFEKAKGCVIEYHNTYKVIPPEELGIYTSLHINNLCFLNKYNVSLFVSFDVKNNNGDLGIKYYSFHIYKQYEREKGKEKILIEKNNKILTELLEQCN